jgi:hypothetical protein
MNDALSYSKMNTLHMHIGLCLKIVIKKLIESIVVTNQS